MVCLQRHQLLQDATTPCVGGRPLRCIWHAKEVLATSAIDAWELDSHHVDQRSAGWVSRENPSVQIVVIPQQDARLWQRRGWLQRHGLLRWPGAASVLRFEQVQPPLLDARSRIRLLGHVEQEPCAPSLASLAEAHVAELNQAMDEVLHCNIRACSLEQFPLILGEVREDLGRGMLLCPRPRPAAALRLAAPDLLQDMAKVPWGEWHRAGQARYPGCCLRGHALQLLGLPFDLRQDRVDLGLRQHLLLFITATVATAQQDKPGTTEACHDSCHNSHSKAEGGLQTNSHLHCSLDQ